MPDTFIGTAQQLAPLVMLLCGELQAAFDEQGRTCPPWRQFKSMLSKWVPAKARDVQLHVSTHPQSLLKSVSSPNLTHVTTKRPLPLLGGPGGSPAAMGVATRRALPLEGAADDSPAARDIATQCPEMACMKVVPLAISPGQRHQSKLPRSLLSSLLGSPLGRHRATVTC